MSNIKIVSDNPKVCCQELHPQVNVQGKVDCGSKFEVSSCTDMLSSGAFRFFLWLFAAMALLGNGGVIMYRLRTCRNYMARSYHILVMNLSLADFLMGVYMLILGAFDIKYKGSYFLKEQHWKRSWACASAGMIGLVSCQVSAFMVAFITLDRLLVTWLPVKTHLHLNHR